MKKICAFSFLLTFALLTTPLALAANPDATYVKRVGGNGSKMFGPLYLSDAGVRFADGTTQSTAASGGGGTVNPTVSVTSNYQGLAAGDNSVTGWDTAVTAGQSLHIHCALQWFSDAGSSVLYLKAITSGAATAMMATHMCLSSGNGNVISSGRHWINGTTTIGVSDPNCIQSAGSAFNPVWYEFDAWILQAPVGTISVKVNLSNGSGNLHPASMCSFYKS